MVTSTEESQKEVLVSLLLRLAFDLKANGWFFGKTSKGRITMEDNHGG